MTKTTKDSKIKKSKKEIEIKFSGRSEASPVPERDDRFPGLWLEQPDPTAKKSDPRSKLRIVADDTQFDIFKCPDSSFLKGSTIQRHKLTPFKDVTKRVGFLDCEWVGADGGQAKGDLTDVLVAISIKNNGKYYTACNKDKSERDLLLWFFTALNRIRGMDTIAGYSCYGFYRREKGERRLIPTDFHMIYHRSLAHGINECPWEPRGGDFPDYKWQNAIVFGKPLEAPAWSCSQYQLIDINPQLVLFDCQNRKLNGYSLKEAVIGLGLRDERRIEIGDRIYEYWAKGDIETIKEYLEYDVEDTEKLWNFLLPQSYFTLEYLPAGRNWNLERVTTTGTGSWWNRYLINVKGERPQATMSVGCQGALTFYMAGTYRNCAKFDYSSLYPSIMLTYLIASYKDEDYTALRALMYFMTRRDEIRSSEEYKNGSPELEGQQQTTKVRSNSLYGLWNTKGLNFNDPYAAAAITAYGRQLARYMITWLAERGVETIALDTDGAVVKFVNDNYTDEERDREYIRLCEELNSTLPGYTCVKYEDAIPLIWIPPNLTDPKGSAKTLADKLNSIEWYDNSVNPADLEAGLSKNYLYFSYDKDGKPKLNKKGKFRKRDKMWLETGFVIELISKLFYDGEELARDYALEVRDQIMNGILPVDKLSAARLIRDGEKELPSYGFDIGTKPTIHYVFRGNFKGVRKKKPLYEPSDDPNELYASGYYLQEFKDILAETPIKIEVDVPQLTPETGVDQLNLLTLLTTA
jgi:DNA polymerase elongation subunit (family B)